MTHEKKTSAKALHALLPQTQCQLCDYKDCMAYAQAISDGEAAIDRCAPGGVPTLHALAALTKTDPEPYLNTVKQNTKPLQTVRIDEDACIGCTKCIQACPVDAIMGRSKHMHTVIQSECSGCELCIAPCPVDCIEIVPEAPRHPMATAVRAKQYLQRYQQREARLKNQPIHHSDGTPMDEQQRAQKVASRKTSIADILKRTLQR